MPYVWLIVVNLQSLRLCVYSVINMIECLGREQTRKYISQRPKLSVRLRMFLITLAIIASAKRSFGKLKLIKNYLRSTMSQDCISNLARFNILSGIAKQIDFYSAYRWFAKKSYLRSCFNKIYQVFDHFDYLIKPVEFRKQWKILMINSVIDMHRAYIVIKTDHLRIWNMYECVMTFMFINH